MEFINKKISGVFKIILVIAAILIFIKIFPLLILVGIVAYGGNKLLKYIKKFKNEKIGKVEKDDIKSEVYEEQNYYDFSNKKVIDVEYEDIKHN